MSSNRTPTSDTEMATAVRVTIRDPNGSSVVLTRNEAVAVAKSILKTVKQQ